MMKSITTKDITTTNLMKAVLCLLGTLAFCGSTQSFGDIQPVRGVRSPHQRGPRDDAKTGVGDTCKSDDPNHICLALKYVVYQEPTGDPLLTQAEVSNNLIGINQLWKQCNLSFQVDEFLTANPDTYGLQFHPSDNSELDGIRSSFGNESMLLVVTTGSWNRNGSLGSTPANAWTSMPGDDLLGSILEGPVDTFSNIVAHELGHYLSLAHVEDAGDLMNPIIYDSSVILSEDQCSDARTASQSYWQKMLR